MRRHCNAHFWFQADADKLPPIISTKEEENQDIQVHADVDKDKDVDIDGALSIYRGHFSSCNSRKTPHISPVRARYGVSFVSANLTEALSL